MSERTTIGGTIYETVGSSSSNLLLRCNGTARIQWGGRLIDLIKNGKLASDDGSLQVALISDISEITKDGIYVLETDSRPRLFVCKNDKQFDITGSDLYISASTKLDTTADQQKQALENIGMYYDTLEEVQKANIKDGLVYVLSEKKLYTIKEGVIEEFEAKLRTIAVEQQKEKGEVINDALKIVLSIEEQEYIIINKDFIKINQSIQMSDNASLSSENASEASGYRLYMLGGISCLDVDRINVREGVEISEYVEITFLELLDLMGKSKVDATDTNENLKEKLVPHTWYLITDYQNPWKLPADDIRFNRPILVRALTETSLYPEGYLYNDRSVVIHYDPSFIYSLQVEKSPSEEPSVELPKPPSDIESNVEVAPIDDIPEEEPSLDTHAFIKTRGLITWMRDGNGNSANFDFLDYTDSNGQPLTTLHYLNDDTQTDKSIFPRYSLNNLLTVTNLKGITLKENESNPENPSKIYSINKDEGVVIDFQIQDSEQSLVETPLPVMSMCNNTLNVTGNLIVNNTCTEISNNKFLEISNVSISGNITNSTFLVLKNTNIALEIFNSVFGEVDSCSLGCSFKNSSFKNLISCSFGEGVINYTTGLNDILNYVFNALNNPILYDPEQEKRIKMVGNQCNVISDTDSVIPRGTITMYSGLEDSIPTGWAVCDGGTYLYNGKSVTTPNLVNRFIKAVATKDSIGPVDNSDLNSINELKLLEAHLPNHSHPHAQHTHTISGLTGTIGNSGDLTLQLSDSNYVNGVSQTNADVVGSIDNADIACNSAVVVNSVGSTKQGGTATGGNHTHSITISGGTISNTTSAEQNKTWTNLVIKIEPNYYSLIFIMKL